MQPVGFRPRDELRFGGRNVGLDLGKGGVGHGVLLKGEKVGVPIGIRHEFGVRG